MFKALIFPESSLNPPLTAPWATHASINLSPHSLRIDLSWRGTEFSSPRLTYQLFLISLLAQLATWLCLSLFVSACFAGSHASL